MRRIQHVTGENYVRQVRAAENMMHGYYEYARSIGCAVVHDEIQCSQVQAKMLTEWMQRRVADLNQK